MNGIAAAAFHIMRPVAAVGAILLLGMAGHGFAQAPKVLHATLGDYVEMPATGLFDIARPRSNVARVNYFVEEPGAPRLFVTDQNGQIYILDRKSRQLAPYLVFNGSGAGKGMFARFLVDTAFASGLVGIAFDPDYRRTGKFYTLHMEDAVSTASAVPKTAGVPKLDVSGYAPTKAIAAPSAGTPIARESVLVEWTDTNPADTEFEGSAREILRVQLVGSIHPVDDLTFNPSARPGDRDWRVLYISAGDGGAGELTDSRRFNPQRLDNFGGKILRIIPDLREHASTSQVSENGKYRIPRDNPFAGLPGARKEIWAYGMRNPHRMAWDRVSSNRADMLAFVIGSNGGDARYETVDLITRGANFGYPLREGPDLKPLSPVYGFVPNDRTLPVRISDTVVLGDRVPMRDSALAYKTGSQGSAIAGGFVYHGKKWPALQGSLVFGDITSGRIFAVRMSALRAATDGDPATLAAYTEIGTDLAATVLKRALARSSPGASPPPAIPDTFRVDMRLAVDSDGEIYVLTKSDGMIRRIESIE
jgi:hypothetical protein